MQTCPQCGNENAVEANFCSNCGTKLDAASLSATTITFAGVIPRVEGEDAMALSDAEVAAVDALPPGSALLIVQRGPGAGSRYLLDKELVSAGRHPKSDIFLDDITVSRKHAEFRRHDDTYAVVDSGSLNGTYVNRDRIDEVVLQNGDEVRIGKFRLVFFSGLMGR